MQSDTGRGLRHGAIATVEPATLLQVWEVSRGWHPVRRTLALLDFVMPVSKDQGWAAMPVGPREQRVLDLHETLFGAQLHTVVDCPGCGHVLEAELAVAQIRVADTEPGDVDEYALQDGDIELRYRLPNTSDLDAVSRIDDEDQALGALVQRCVLQAWRAGARMEVHDLPLHTLNRLDAQMAALDPAACNQVRMACPTCGLSSEFAMDLTGYFWSECEIWAQQTLAEVHLLACAYGWSEQAILALSATRRQAYVEMVRS